MSRPVPSRELKRQQLRLEQFLVWAVPFDFLFASLQVVAYWWFDDTPTRDTAIVMFGYGTLLLLARRQTREGEVGAAVRTICYGLLAADVLIAILQPALFPTLALVPLLAVTLALPYVDGDVLRRFSALAALTTAIVVLCGNLVPSVSSLPQVAVVVFLIISVLLVVLLILLLLWQFSSRLTDTLARTRAAEERYSLAARGANDGLWDWDLLTGQVYYSDRWKEMFGYSESEIGTEPDEWFSRVHPDERTRVNAEIGVHCDGLTPHFESEHRLMDSNGRYRWVLARGLAVFDAHRKATRVAGSMTDITVRKEVEARLIHDALHDALTGLPNRAMFMERLERSVKRVRREPDYRFALIYMDLDRFKVVNDSLGHSAGDEMLVEIGRRLLAGVSRVDTVARLGGDEFAVLLENIADVAAATAAADRIQDSMRAPFSLQNSELVSAISMGIAISNTDYEIPEQVLRDADIALYRAKAMGRARHIIFARAMHVHAVELLQLEIDLRRAIERREFVVYYQPIVALATGQITGFEALARWQHPTRGLLEPVDFIEIAEETGLIAPIGWFVLREACRQLRIWQAQLSHPRPLTMSVNISGTQIAHPDLAAHLESIFTEFAPAPGQLRLEITEAVMMTPQVATSQLLELLNLLGIQLQIDDFGTGYSSLSVMHEFPVSALKIDRSFISRLGTGGENVEMIAAILTLARQLDLEVIAEGVEFDEQADQLRRLNCDYAQGFLFSPPLDARGAAALLRSSAAARLTARAAS